MQLTMHKNNSSSIEFTNLVIGTYASAFAAYNNETVKVLPIRSGVLSAQSSVRVRTVIHRTDGANITVNYKWVKFLLTIIFSKNLFFVELFLFINFNPLPLVKIVYLCCTE